MIFITMVSLAIIAMASFAVDLGAAYVARSQNQLIADLAAYSGGVAYSASSTTSAMTYAISRMATLNGLASGDISSGLVSSPSGDGNNAVKAAVTTSSPAYLGSSIGLSDLSVKAIGYAEIKSGTPGCIVALQSSGTGLSVTGGASITASNCTVASNGTVTGQASSVYTACGTTVKTTIVDYASANPPVQATCTAIVPPAGTASVTLTHATSTDQLAGSSEVASATGRIATAAAVASPATPSVSGGTPVYVNSSTISTLPSGCTAKLTKSTWAITCSGHSSYTFGTIALTSGVSTTFSGTAPSGTPTFYFNGDINGSVGTSMTFGAGNYVSNNGIAVGSGMTMSFAAGSNITLGPSATCSTGYSVCVSSTGKLTISGPGTYSFAGGISQSGTGSLSIGAGSTANSYAIGKSTSSPPYSIYNTGGSVLMGDATGTGGTFTAAGGIGSTGGTCIQLPAAAEHDINGSINAAGGMYLGSGIYTVNGFAAFGAATGGDVSNCPSSGSTTGVSALGVSLVISGTSTVTCSGFSGASFCLGQGYSTVLLTAPTATSTLGSSLAGLAVVGPTVSTNTGGAELTTGATNTQVSGVFYFPYGTLTMSGGATLHDTVDTGPCLELIAASINISAGGALGTTCSGLPGSYAAGSATVSLVQ